MSSQNILREKLFGYFSTFLLKTFSKNVLALDLFSMLAVFEFTDIVSLSLMLLVPNLANTKWWKIPWKWLKPWHMGTHLRVLSESYPIEPKWQGLDVFQNCLHPWASSESSLSIGRVKVPIHDAHMWVQTHRSMHQQFDNNETSNKQIPRTLCTTHQYSG